LRLPNQYIPNDTEEITQRLKKEIGIKEIRDLFSDIPRDILLVKNLDLPGPLSELEVKQEVEKVLEKNCTVKELTSFLGAGIGSHFVPAVVDEVSSRSEFLTSYTPYQPEISQGILQAFFEYQSMICTLLNMDISNCSMYDWASSLGEAALMTARVTRRNEFLVPHLMSPERRAVLRAYAGPAKIKVEEINQDPITGQFDLEDLKKKISKNTAGVYVENPSYLGFLIANLESISEIIHDVKGLFILGVDPISLGILKPPGDYMADIAVGEGQALGNYMNAGGSLLGIFACRDATLVRHMPGRIVGMTTTQNEKDRAFCLALQTREQHIRRDKATSNICTNQALCALRAAVYMVILGKRGFKELGEIILSRTYYAIKKLSEIDGLRVPLFHSGHFKEFTINFDQKQKSNREINQGLLEHGIIGGKPLDLEFPEFGQTSLYCITETTTFEQIEKLKRNVKKVWEN